MVEFCACLSSHGAGLRLACCTLFPVELSPLSLKVKFVATDRMITNLFVYIHLNILEIKKKKQNECHQFPLYTGDGALHPLPLCAGVRCTCTCPTAPAALRWCWSPPGPEARLLRLTLGCQPSRINSLSMYRACGGSGISVHFVSFGTSLVFLLTFGALLCPPVCTVLG